MIKIFRKIRQKLLTKNKFSKPASPAGRYLLYAIGEIVLVVIGILIALQINNWNERQKEQKLTDIYYCRILDDFILDKELIEKSKNQVIDQFFMVSN